MPFKGNIKTQYLDLVAGETPVPRVKFERRFGHPIPDALAQLFSEKFGAIRFQDGVEATALEPNPLSRDDQTVAFSQIAGMTSGRDGLLALWDRYRGRLAIDGLPFADDGLGNLLVWNPNNGSVMLWYHEHPEGEGSREALSLVAKSFDAFLSSVRIKQEKKIGNLGVKHARLPF